MSIICGTDLSAASAGALDVALALAPLRGDREVVLVHIVDPELGGSPSAREAAFEQARAELDEQARGKAPPGVAIRCELLVGPPDKVLTELAAAEGSNLIVIAARSTSTSLLRLGTTTTKVIAHTSVPVLVVRDPAPWLAYASRARPIRVMLGIDDTATCELGIQWTHGLRAGGPVEVVLGAIYYPDDAANHYGLPPHGMIDSDPEIERLLSRDLVRRFGGERAPDVVARAPPRGGRVGAPHREGA
ncbi:MAG: universal stress protein, partial [Kofleriaceae bacterium]